MNHKIFFILLFIIFIFLSAEAEEMPLLLTDQGEIVSLKEAAVWFVEAGKNHTIETIENNIFTETLILDSGNPDSVIWSRYTVKAEQKGTWIIFSRGHKGEVIDYYARFSDSRIETGSAGNRVPMDMRSFPYRRPAFQLSLAAGETVTVYLAVQNRSAFVQCHFLILPCCCLSILTLLLSPLNQSCIWSSHTHMYALHWKNHVLTIRVLL